MLCRLLWVEVLYMSLQSILVPVSMLIRHVRAVLLVF